VPTRDRALFEVFGRLPLPMVRLGELPTPVQPLGPVQQALGSRSEAWVKRDDLSSDVYGGNKIRTLEVLFAEALAQGATHVYATGAFGSNHAVATLLHAPRVGLRPGALLFPQPPSLTALENLRVLASADADRLRLLHWSQLPFAVPYLRASRRLRGARPFVMVPGGATPRGALGYVSAALELAKQVAAGELPPPRAIVVGVGSTCTSAGLLVGLQIAARLGIGFAAPPRLVAVRVTPWPITSATLIVRLATRASALLESLTGDPRCRVSRAVLRANLEVDGTQLGRGYGRPTAAGREAIALFARVRNPRPLALDTTYSGKAAAALVARLRANAPGPWLFWSTKSTAPLPAHGASPSDPVLRGWMARAAGDGGPPTTVGR